LHHGLDLRTEPRMALQQLANALDDWVRFGLS